MHRTAARLLSLAGALCAAVAVAAPATPAYAGFSYDVAISKSHTGNFTVGTPGTFTITLTHVSGSPTNTDSFTLTDTLPTGLTYVSNTGASIGFTCGASAQVVTCTGQPSLTTGMSKSFTLTVAVGAAARPSATNLVVISSPPDNNPANNSASDTVVVNAAPSPSPSPTAAPSPSPSPSAAVLALPRAGSASGSPAGPLMALVAVLLAIAGAGVALIRVRS
jgi:uncharacterized repeat protein (TIGR01451 family)